MKRFLIIFSLSILFRTALVAQNYYQISDSSIIVGCEIIDGGYNANSRICQVKKGSKIIEYTPAQIMEYGFSDGRSYRSHKIKIDNISTKVFLERLSKGKLNLFYFKDGKDRRFYISTKENPTPIEVPKKFEEYNQFLKPYISDCNSSLNNLDLVSFRKDDFKRFFDAYNVCKRRIVPISQYGFFVGAKAFIIKSTDDAGKYSLPENINDAGYSLGAFLDIPVFSNSFFIHSEIGLNRFKTSKSFTANNNKVLYSIDIKNTSVSIPLLFRYRLIKNTFSPFIQGGLVYSRAIKNEGEWSVTSWENNSYVQDVDYISLLQDDLGGFSIGGGAISHIWYGEIRYSKFYNLSSNNKLANLNDISFSVGFFF